MHGCSKDIHDNFIYIIGGVLNYGGKSLSKNLDKLS